MNGITEPLPGLLDDPQFQISDLPALTDFHIAPLRNPAPARHANIPSPLEPLAANVINSSRTPQNTPIAENGSRKRRTPTITPSDVLSAREAKRPHLAINELLEASDDADPAPVQLPSFISLAAVEKSPIPASSSLEDVHAHAHARGQAQLQTQTSADADGDGVSHDLIRRLPRPAQKDGRPQRPAPLLPAMVTGLHEPPPSAALLPSINVESRPGIARSVTSSSKMNVKDMLTQSEHASPGAASSTAPPTLGQEPSPSRQDHKAPSPSSDTTPAANDVPAPAGPWKDNKPRRARRKWTLEETKHLVAGVKKYGVGKWKQILEDPAFSFVERSSVDLKDRYRVCANNDSLPKLETTPSHDDAPAQGDATSSRANTPSGPGSPPTSPVELPLPPKQRRKRRAWTAVEDENLIRGVTKHGFQWTAIHDDPDLDLGHRRATDLRDRIRNKFPDGYKHAETAPLRSELKKAEKAHIHVGVTAVAVPPPVTAPTSRSVVAPVVSVDTPPGLGSIAKSNSSSALMSMLMNPDTEADGERARDREVELDAEKAKLREKEREAAPGVTLPSFNSFDDEMDWGDNRLPPLHEWDDMGL